MDKFTERLKELRKEKGLSQYALAKKTGLSHSAIAFWEQGQRVPSLEAAKTLAVFFGVSIDYLAGLED